MIAARIGIAIALFSGAVLGACASSTPAGQVCATGNFEVDDAFDGARRGTCHVVDAETVRLEIRREDEYVTNKSPWYAFRLTPKVPGPATVVLDYGNFEHRYVPKLSNDGVAWTTIEPARVTLSEDAVMASVQLELTNDPLYVSAQELLMPDWYASKISPWDADPEISVSVLGKSLEGRDIQVVEHDGPARDVVMLIGRQHPPEISGAYAFFQFAETLLGDTPLARQFRERFDVIAIPILNPDGVVHGHWRHNRGDTDLNRDWGVFAQPETALMGKLLERLEADDRQLAYFLDFHSTNRNLFYTFPHEFLNPPQFFDVWFSRARERIVDYPFFNENNPPSNDAVSKNYINRRYGIISASYEVGDETDRDIAAEAAAMFAEEFMKLLLEL